VLEVSICRKPERVFSSSMYPDASRETLDTPMRPGSGRTPFEVPDCQRSSNPSKYHARSIVRPSISRARVSSQLFSYEKITLRAHN